MRCELIVARLDGFQTLGAFARWRGYRHSVEAGSCKSFPRGLAETRRYVRIRNDGATSVEFESRAFLAQAGQETIPDLDVVTAMAQWDFDDAHAPRIRA